MIDCFWWISDDHGYQASCGRAASALPDPTKTGMRYCPQCGWSVIEIDPLPPFLRVADVREVNCDDW